MNEIECLKESELIKILSNKDIINSCITRMCITDDKIEFNDLYISALDLVQNSYYIIKARFEEVEND